MLFQKTFENTDPCFVATMLIMKTETKEIYENTSVSFKSHFSHNC